jgi:CheY-like chemotaxis protein
MAVILPRLRRARPDAGVCGHRVPILVVSGSDGQGQSELRAFRLGATAYLAKPVEPLVLAEGIGQLIRSARPTADA